MKPFNLKRAKSGDPVQTRDGKTVRIICFDREHEDYPIIALVKEDSVEWTAPYTSEGFIFKDKAKCGDDLVMAPKKIKVRRWFNLYPDGCSPGYISEDLADRVANPDRIECRLIEWEIEE